MNLPHNRQLGMEISPSLGVQLKRWRSSRVDLLHYWMCAVSQREMVHCTAWLS